MAQSRPLCIGMDVHTDARAVAYVAPAHGAEGMYLGTMGTRQYDIDQLIRKRPAKAQHLIFVSDAGPCGDWLYRYLTQKGDDCWVVAPSLIPQNPGDRVKTDRRDAVQLARLARSGARTAVDVPTVDEAAMRDLTRARADPRSACTDAKLRLKACLLRPDIRDTGRANWRPAHLRGLSDGVCPAPAQHMVLQEYVRAGSAHSERRQRLDQALQDHVKTWPLAPGGDALHAGRGGQCPVAVPLMAAMGDLRRLESPRELLKLLGRIPSEPSSGEHRRQGSITKAGPPPARRGRVEGAWAYRSPAKLSRHLPLRLEQQPQVIQDLRWKAQGRRCKRYRRLVARGKHSNVGPGAIARAWRGFLWAMAQEVSLGAENAGGF